MFNLSSFDQQISRFNTDISVIVSLYCKYFKYKCGRFDQDQTEIVLLTNSELIACSNNDVHNCIVLSHIYSFH